MPTTQKTNSTTRCAYRALSIKSNFLGGLRTARVCDRMAFLRSPKCVSTDRWSKRESLLKLESVLSARNLGVALKCRKRLFRNSSNFNKPNWLQLAGVGEENDFGAPFSLEIHFCLSWLIKGFERRGKKFHKSRNTCNRMTPWKSNASTRT